jgi:hypothetical protein
MLSTLWTSTVSLSDLEQAERLTVLPSSFSPNYFPCGVANLSRLNLSRSSYPKQLHLVRHQTITFCRIGLRQPRAAAAGARHLRH